MIRSQIVTFIMVFVLVTTVAVVTRSMVEGSPAPPPESPAPAAEEQPEPDPTPDEPDQPTEVEAELEPAPDEQEQPEPHVQRVDLDGQDLADLLDLRAWKFDYALPSDEYTVHVWVEHWRQDAEQPDVRPLLNQSLNTESGSMLLRLPTEDEPELFVRVGSAVARSADAAPIRIPTPFRRDVLDRQPIDFDEPLHLITFTHNESDRPEGGLADVHRDHDVTVYIKARFFQGANVPFDEELVESN